MKKKCRNGEELLVDRLQQEVRALEGEPEEARAIQAGVCCQRSVRDRRSARLVQRAHAQDELAGGDWRRRDQCKPTSRVQRQ